jgi:hypothetical protein
MAKRFDNCILHIGTEKTGTTTLQGYLAATREPLLKQGYFVPSSLSPYPDAANHERLTTYALNPDKTTDDLRIAAGLRSSDEVAAHRVNTLESLRAEISALQEVPANLLLSNEHCHSRLVEDEEVFLLKSMLDEFAEHFRIVVYLRPQHDLAISLYGQALKAGHFDIDILPVFDRSGKYWVRKRYFNYWDLLSRWSTVFGDANITARIYSRKELVGESVVEDFMKIIGAEFAGMAGAPNLNVNISEELQPALNAFNRVTQNNPLEMSRDHRARLIKVLESASQGRGSYPARTEVQKFFQMFEESNEEVRRLFFPDRDRLFVTDFSEFPEEASAAIPETDALVRVITLLLDGEHQLPLP